MLSLRHQWCCAVIRHAGVRVQPFPLKRSLLTLAIETSWYSPLPAELSDSLAAVADQKTVMTPPLPFSRNTMEASRSQTAVQRAQWPRYISTRRSPPTTASSEAFIP